MQRSLMDQLVAWKNSARSKPLILNGARQVGKTWLLKEFGRLHFESVAYVSLDNDALARSYFDSDFDISRIISSLSLELDMDIEPGKTLIVLDEVQACPKAITSLKYFCENAPEYAVAAAGSLLGISATEGTGFPVGKVNMLDLHPLSFDEFLEATGNGRFAELVASGDIAMMNSFSGRLTELLKQYYVVGGMPEAVNAFVAERDVRAARSVQPEILNGYVSDFAKHIPPRLLARTMLAWESIPRHLSQENKKFVYGKVRRGSRAADFEESLAWLERAGLIHKVRRAPQPLGLPRAGVDAQRAPLCGLLQGPLGVGE
jgi:predicted AAA+ superfamily ATPase